MINLKKYLTGISVVLLGFVYGQGGSSSTYYQITYENQSKSGEVISTNSEPILSPKEKIDFNLEDMKSSAVLRNANWGFVVYDPKTKKVVSSYNENASLIPASTTKLLTTETAMDLLGPNFRWITQLEYSGEIDEKGVLNGNLYILGSGDPSLGTGKAGANTYGNTISQFVSAVREQGVKKVNGDIIMQTVYFKENKVENLPANIVWMENGNYYLPVGSTENIDPRKEKLTAKSGIFASDSKKYFYVSPYTQKMVYAEEYLDKPFNTKLPEPPAYLSTNFRANLVKGGIGVTGKVITKLQDPQPENRKLITAYKSPTLSEIIYYTNQRSDNALAEATLRMVGFQKAGDQSLESGRAVVQDHLEKSAFDTTGFSYVDGSGLSRGNLVTPIAQVKFLSSLMSKNYYKTYFDSLPIGGQSGTLKSMFLGSGYGNVHAKTGTLNKVKTLAGYIQTSSGKLLVFSLMFNNYAGSVAQAKSTMEKILEPVFFYY